VPALAEPALAVIRFGIKALFPVDSHIKYKYQKKKERIRIP